MAATSTGDNEQGSFRIRSKPSVNINLAAITGPSRVYIVEHIVVHFSLILLAISGVALFNSVIDHWLNEETSGSAFSAVLSFEQLAIYMAMAIVGLPLFILFYTRTRKAERLHSELLEARARRRLVYLTLAVAAVVLIGYAIGFVYASILALISAESVGDAESWGHTVLKQLFALAYIGLIAYFVSRLTPGIEGRKK